MTTADPGDYHYYDYNAVEGKEHGVADMLFLFFTTPVEIRTVDGLERSGLGACILYGPHFPQWFRGTAGELGLYFLYIGRNYDPMPSVPPTRLNRLFRPSDTTRIPSLIEQARRERDEGLLHCDRIAALLVDRLLAFVFGDASDTGAASGSGVISGRQRRALFRMREQVGEDLSYAWTVDDMAEMAGLSPSRFFTVYKQLFGASPMDDLIAERMDRARWLLRNEPISIAVVAERCGFASIYHFSRTFKKRVGSSPTQFRRASVEP